MNNDLISREALKEAINSSIAQATKVGIMVDADYLWELLNYAIDNAPTVDLWEMRQEATENALKKAEVLYGRPQGKWIRKVDEVGFISHICSECGAEIEVEDCSDDKFCFNCGAKMQKGNKE